MMPDCVRVTDVAPRDGLQNEPGAIPATAKIALIDAVSASGVDEVEVTSFVSARWVPQLGDAREVFSAITPRDSVVYSALVPNERGLDDALAVRAATAARGRAIPDKLAVFTAASQTFAQRNTNATIEQTIERFRPVAAACAAERIPLRAYISCAVACPFEGPIDPGAVRRVAHLLLELGAEEIDLGDTIGAATPDSIGALLDAVLPAIDPRDPFGPRGPALTLHLHDTFGAAAACAGRAMSMGVHSFDASAGGLGGCPYASTPRRSAPGNISTASLLGAIASAGLRSGVDPVRAAEAAALARRITARGPAG